MALEMSSFLLSREGKGCVVGWGGEEMPDRMVMHGGGDKPRFNLSDLGCRDIISERMRHNIKCL